MGHLSPASSHLSPKSAPPTTNFNPFSPLSPHLHGRQLSDDDQEEPAQRKYIVYSRTKLLSIAKQCRAKGWRPPATLGRLDECLTSPIKPQSPLEDPAIAQIGSGAQRNGGFGFGGGIGGRRGGKQMGRRNEPDVRRNEPEIRRPEPEPRANFAQMGQFAVRGDRIKMGGDMGVNVKRDAEWRRGGGPSRPSEDAEPAWMDSAEDPAIAVASADPLIKFVPGEDMIAAHKRAMKAKEDGRWRDQMVAESSAPRQFNAADYLLPTRDLIEPEIPVKENAFQSRFQRFFAADKPTMASPPPPPPPPEHAPPRVDDHMARLMGLLQTKSPPPGNPNHYQPEQPTQIHPIPQQSHYPHVQQFPPNPHSHQPYPPPYPVYRQSGPDPLQLLANAQRQNMMPQQTYPQQYNQYPSQNAPVYPPNMPPPSANHQEMLATLFSGLRHS